jgi:RimJ/RimL family protein N-acetyltransferase
MEKRLLESERLLLRPLSFYELQCINSNEVDVIEPRIELNTISDSIRTAISKKIEKMKKVSEDVHEWYTYWLIVDKVYGKGIGFIGFKGIPDDNGYTEVGYSIDFYYRGKGLMSEALSLLISWASKHPTCKGITATQVLKTNIGSNKVLNNCNFILLGSLNEYNNYIYKFSE